MPEVHASETGDLFVDVDGKGSTAAGHENNDLMSWLARIWPGYFQFYLLQNLLEDFNPFDYPSAATHRPTNFLAFIFNDHRSLLVAGCCTPTATAQIRAAATSSISKRPTCSFRNDDAPSQPGQQLQQPPPPPQRPPCIPAPASHAAASEAILRDDDEQPSPPAPLGPEEPTPPPNAVITQVNGIPVVSYAHARELIFGGVYRDYLRTLYTSLGIDCLLLPDRG